MRTWLNEVSCRCTLLVAVCLWASAALLHHSGIAFAQVPSSDRITFLTERDGNREIYSMRPDGSAQTNLSHSPANEITHNWSPNGSKIAFLRQGDFNLYVMNADGTGVTKLTNNDFFYVQITNLSWSPDGMTLAYVEGSDLLHDLSLINADGTNQRRLAQSSGPFLDVVWSPDGTKIAYSLGRDFNQSNIFVINTDGTGTTRLTHNEEAGIYNRSPAWSPDSRYLAFESNRDGNDEIYVLSMPASFGETALSSTFRLTTNPAADIDPTWSPEGGSGPDGFIAFASNRDGNFEIYKTSWYSGVNAERLTNSNAPDVAPKWLPSSPRAGFDNTVQFSTAAYRFFEDPVASGAGFAEIYVTRLGLRNSPARVLYRTVDGTATQRSDYTAVSGMLDFVPGQSVASFIVPITYDSLTEGDETVKLELVVVSSSAYRGSQTSAQLTISDFYINPPPPNVLDVSDNFVRQQYHDFLSREPDASGLEFWTSQITACGADAACVGRKRVDVSGAFFNSIEFQETGYFVYRVNVASLGGFPLYHMFLSDAQLVGQGVVVGQSGWEQRLQQNQEKFLQDWVLTDAFIVACGGTRPNSEFVDILLGNSRIPGDPEYRNGLIADLDAHRKTKVDVLREIVDHPFFKTNEFTRAFVLMQYFGYLRRNPADPPDNNLDGYNFWLTKLNEFGGDFRRAEMVKAFITSTEYRRRFGQP